MNEQIVYKCPKGTVDYRGNQQLQRQRLEQYITELFVLYGAVPLSTPVFEVTDAITKGCDTDTAKETFELIPEDDNAERYTLRYDQTMPLARHCKENKITKMTTYRFGDVFRRDQPNMGARRFRSFRQGDFDRVCLEEDEVSSDADVLSLLICIIANSKLKHPFVVMINTVGLLKDILRYAKIPVELDSKVARCLDKIGKQSWQTVSTELSGFGITDEQLEVLLKCCKTGPVNMKGFSRFAEFASAETIEYFEQIFKYLNCIFTDEALLDWVFICPTLARGLDYYTGIVFEATISSPKKKDNIGSIAAGGRYDGLCGPGTKCIGFSIGIDRITKYLEMPSNKECAPQVWVIQINGEDTNVDELYFYRFDVLRKLRLNNISSGMEMRKDASMATQIRYVLKTGIPYVIFVGDDELRKGTVTLKVIETKTQNEMMIMEAVNIITSSTNTSKE
jgi:histidyl-tRNA synthetase